MRPIIRFVKSAHRVSTTFYLKDPLELLVFSSKTIAKVQNGNVDWRKQIAEKHV